ncbi:MAG: glucosamine-6-phosphate deaminase [Defluviitaleaceae bacterium]|nr:glucosamine-6-phosphate deaminase [Defluviitaleaceae bacterium]
MEIKIVKDYEALSLLASGIILNQITQKPSSVLGLATGSTPVGTYKQLVHLYNKGYLRFLHVKTFNLDEYHPIEKENDKSYHYFMKEKLFNHIDINMKNTFIPDGRAKNPEEECDKYESLIERVGHIDLQLLGLGLNGHIGFNEPSDIFSKTTCYVKLDESTIEANARFFEDKSLVPKHGITMGIATIMKAKHILLLISGENKADIAKEVLFGDITPKAPGSILQLHDCVTVILDEAAAKNLSCNIP